MERAYVHSAAPPFGNALSETRARNARTDRIGRWNDSVAAARRMSDHMGVSGLGNARSLLHKDVHADAPYKGRYFVEQHVAQPPTGHQRTTEIIKEVGMQDADIDLPGRRNVRFLDNAPEHIATTTAEPRKEVKWKWNRVITLEVQNSLVERNLRKRDAILAIVSFLGVGTMVFSSIITWYTNPARESGLDGVAAPEYKDLDPSETGEQICNILNYITSGTTVVCFYLISRYYQALHEKKCSEWSRQMATWQRLPTKKELQGCYSFWRSSLGWYWSVEMFIHLVHPMPFMDGTSKYITIRQKTIYSYLQLWMLARCYLIFRVMHTSHPAYRKRFEILYNNEQLSMMNFKVTWWMTMKLYLYQNTRMSMLCMTIFLFVFFGFALFILERVEQPLQFGEMEITLFYCFTTSVTIGYGRVTTIAKAGRAVTFLLGCYGQIVLTIFTGVITNTMEPSREEELIRNYVASTEAEHHYRIAAALLIQSAWKSSQTYKVLRGTVSHSESQRFLSMRAAAKLRKNVRQEGNDYVEMQNFEFGGRTAAILRGDEVESVSLAGSSSSPRRSVRDGSSIGRSEGTSKREGQQAEHQALLDKAQTFGSTPQKSTGSGLITFDMFRPNNRKVNNANLSQIGKSSERSTRYQQDMHTVGRLKDRKLKKFDTNWIANQKRGLLGDMVLRGTTREELSTEEYPTYIRRRQQANRRCAPLYAPAHKSNFLFESLKRFRTRRRELARTKIELKDMALEGNLKSVGSLIVKLDDHYKEHVEDRELMSDMILTQLREVRTQIENKFGNPQQQQPPRR